MVRVPYDGARIAVLVLRLVEGAHPVSVLKVYDPAECDEHGVPLDWERCRTCEGHKLVKVLIDGEDVGYDPQVCPTCDGHGSLHEAARFEKATRVAEPGHAACAGTGKLVQVWPQADGSGEIGDQCHCVTLELRCESCAHPMSDGTWEGAPCWDEATRAAFAVGVVEAVQFGSSWASFTLPIFWSPCYEGCRHQGDMRARNTDPAAIKGGWGYKPPFLPGGPQALTAGEAVARVADEPRIVIEASWRAVDVRTLGWPHDLRPEKLAILCLRCWAERTTS
jgi:hypothetical protein